MTEIRREIERLLALVDVDPGPDSGAGHDDPESEEGSEQR
jgi:hypothetical protein